MDSNLGYHLLPTRLQEQQKRSIIISHHPKKPLAKMDDDCIDSDGEDVPISVSEEEETQMESEDEEKEMTMLTRKMSTMKTRKTPTLTKRKTSLT